MPDNPKPDEFGRYRVKTDTGAHISINREPLPSERVLKQPASDIGGDPLPTTYPGDEQDAASTPVTAAPVAPKES